MSQIQDIMQQVDELSTDDLLNLLSYIAQRARIQARLEANRPKWSDICGMAPDLLGGEDAQEWVKRTRQEDTEHREALIRG